jgi:flavin-dependent dehydrogenase
MLDVLIAGAGPAGSVAGWVLARAGARVLLVDRDAFPRPKLCGDTLNPGAIALLESLGLGDGPWHQGPALTGMLVTGPRARVRARYPAGLVGRSILRSDLDAWLLDRAIAAGARFESGWTVREPLGDQRVGGPLGVRGVAMTRSGQATPLRVPASITIAADGRRSALARALGLSRHPKAPRRWAFGTYATGVGELSDVGEMHVRPGYYLGIAPVPAGRANVCVVTGPRPDGRSPIAVIRRAIARDARLADRFTRAEFDETVSVLGPLAVDVRGAGADGLLLAGDAAGFIDPMTGDGLRLAITGAALAAHEALATLERGDLRGAATRLAEARRTALGPKLRFNRALRATVASPWAMTAAGLSAAVVPALINSVVRYAGDTPSVPSPSAERP